MIEQGKQYCTEKIIYHILLIEDGEYYYRWRNFGPNQAWQVSTPMHFGTADKAQRYFGKPYVVVHMLTRYCNVYQKRTETYVGMLYETVDQAPEHSHSKLDYRCIAAAVPVTIEFAEGQNLELLK